MSGQQDLRSQILKTAEQLFTDHGYAGTSVRRIADSAGVNPALVHYYFGSKHKLLTAVLDVSLQPLIDAIAELGGSGSTTVRDISKLLVSTAARQPNMPRLMAREVLLPGGEVQAYFREHLAPRLGGALPALLRREQSEARLRRDADPEITAVLMLGVCIFPFIARSLAEPVLGVEYDNDGIEKLERNVTALLEHGIMT